MTSAPAKKAPARKAAPRKAAASKAEPKDTGTEKAPAEVAGAALYPKGTPLFQWTSPSTGAKIVFPKNNSHAPNRAFFFKIYNLDYVFQGFEWMNEYKVPLAVQAIAVTLPDDEYEALFDAWFADSQVTAGE